MYLRIIIILFFTPIFLFPQNKYDFHSDSLYAVYGADKLKGENDCRVQCDLTSDGHNIIININVKDDSLIFNNSIYSDHIEIWFGYPEMFQYGFDYGKEGNKFSYITGSDKYLYQYQNKPYLKSVIEELKNPFIKDDEGLDSKNYNQLSNSVIDVWLKDEIDNSLSFARNDKLSKGNIFFGVTHFGVYPQNGLVTQYDKQNYNYFKKYLGLEIGELSKFINVQTTVIDNSYKVYLIIKPEALGFVNISGISELKFLIDIIDSDSKGEQSSLLSTSKKRKWGNVDTFNEVKLNKNIDVNINPKLPFLGKDWKTIHSEFENKLRSLCYDTYYFTKKGWKGIQGITYNFVFFNQPSSYTLPNIQRYYFKTNDLVISKVEVGSREITKYTFGKKNYIKLGNEELLDESDIQKIFQLPTGKIALVYCERSWGGGRYQRWDNSKLWFEKEGGNKLLVGKSEYGTFVVNDSLKLDNNDMNIAAMAYENFDWKSILRFDLLKSAMYIKLDNKMVEVQWDEKGNNLKFKVKK